MCDDGGDDYSGADDVNADDDYYSVDDYSGGGNGWGCNDNIGGGGAGWLIFAVLMFIGAAIAFWVALVALTIHSIVKAILAYQEQRYITATLWACLFLWLVHVWAASAG